MNIRSLYRVVISIALLSSILFLPGSAPAIIQPSAINQTPANGKPSIPAGASSPYFEANQGQADPNIRFISRGDGYSLFLSDGEATWLMRSPTGSSQNDDQDFVRMQFSGANPAVQVLGDGDLPGKINYFTSSDPTQWRSNIPTYSAVRYAEIYPGINLLFYAKQNQLEFDFTVNPGNDPNAIRLSFPDAGELSVNAEGNLLIRRSSLTLQLQAPGIYQEEGGARKVIAGAYEITGKNQVGFTLGPYNHSEPLVIDPIIAYSSYLGGRNSDNSFGITVDDQGYVYVTGTTQSDNFPTTPGAFMPSFGTCETCPFFGFLSKFTPDGSTLVYSTYLGPVSQYTVTRVAVDSSGNAYLAGTSRYSIFPTTPGSFQPTCDPGPFNNCADNAFITKFNSSGSELIYSSFLGGGYNYENSTAGHTRAYGIALDAGDNAYVTGETYSMHFPTTAGAFQTSGYADAFVSKINPEGSALVFSTYLGGAWTQGDCGSDGAYGIAVDGSGSAYVAGYACSSNFPLVNPFQGQHNGLGTTDGFVSKLNPAGSELVYSTYLGGGNIDSVQGIAVDPDGDAYLTGQTKSLDFPVLNPLLPANDWTDTTGDGFVTKLNPQGNGLVYSTYLGGLGYDYGTAIAADSDGNAYITGNTESSDFPCTPNEIPCLPGLVGVFATKINPTGSDFGYSNVFGASIYDQGNAIAVHGTKREYVSGVTWPAEGFPTTPNAFQSVSAGGLDAFLLILQDLSGQQIHIYLPVLSRSQ